jgi:hypothetical protein
MLALEEKPSTHTPPAKRWRNYYRVYHVLHMGPHGHWFPGLHPGPSFFPSQDVAESHARAIVAEINPPGRWVMEHVGTFPEDQKPN